MNSTASPDTPHSPHRKLTAILNADVAGYSLLMRDNEAETVAALKHAHEIFQSSAQRHGGRVVDTSGDSVLAEFPSVVNAARCAIDLQKTLRAGNSAQPDDRRMRWRVGINVGDVIVDGARIFGDGVNIAARVQSLAEPGGICISGPVYNEICDKLDFGYEFIGQHKVKNILEPVSVYRLTADKSSARRGRLGWRPTRPAVATLAATLLLAGVVVAGLYGWTKYRAHPSPFTTDTAGQAALAVLPFTHLTQERDQEYFSDGITHDITTELSKYPSLLVIASQATFAYKNKPTAVSEMARDLGVRYVVTGSIQKSGSRLRITATLVDTSSGHPLWTERYDRDLKDVLATQDELADRIVTSLAVTLTDREREMLALRREGNAEAYDFFLRGRALYLLNTPEANRQSRELFSKAVAADPKFARAHAGVAITHEEDVRYQWSGDLARSRAQAIEYAQRAIELDPNSPFGFLVLAHVRLFVEQRYDQAVEAARRATELDPNYADAYTMHGFSLVLNDKPAEAIVLIRKAMRLNPHYPALYPSALGIALYFAGEPANAIPVLHDAIARNDKRISPYIVLAASCVRVGRHGEAKQAIERILALDPEFKAAKVALTHPIKNRAKLDALMADLRRAGLK